MNGDNEMNKAPWNDSELYQSINRPEPEIQAKYEAVWKQFTADCFYFVARNDYIGDQYTTIWAVPCDYFDKEESIWDQSMGIDHLLPPGSLECMESVWDVELDVAIVIAFMNKAGFKKSKQFDTFVQGFYFE